MRRASLIILAGGEARRMGYPKCLLHVPGGPTLVEHLVEKLAPLVPEILVTGRPPPLVEGTRPVRDRYRVHSPLVGLEAGLAASSFDISLVVACDMPFVVPSLADYLLSLAAGADAVVPRVRGYFEPLFAVYRRRILPVVRSHIKAGDLKVTGIYRELAVRAVPEPELRRFDPELKSFINLNTVRDLALLNAF